MKFPFLPLAIFVLFCGQTLPAEDRPNIIFIISDDQGHGDLGYTGNPVIMTPHLEALSAESSN